MKIIWTVIRWFFGVTFCLASIGGFTNGDIGMALFDLAVGLFFLPPVTTALFNQKANDIQKNVVYESTTKSEKRSNSSDKLVNVSSKSVGNKTEMTISLNEENLVALLKQKHQQRETEIRNLVTIQ